MNTFANQPRELSNDQLKEMLEKMETDIQNGQHLLNNITYECGTLGLSLFYCYYALFTKDDTYTARAKEYFSKTLSSLDLSKFVRIYHTDSLDNHLSNLGRFLCFVTENHFFAIKGSAYLEKLDHVLEGLMDSKIAIGDFDYNSGAVASGQYFISRLKSQPTVVNCLVKLVKGFEEKAKRDEDGDYYWISPSLYNNTYFGLSHGSAMVISILSTLVTLGVEVEACLRIITKASQFVLKHHRDIRYSHFPISLNDENLQDKPFCICYGDIGIGYALMKANRLLDREDIGAVADQIFEESLERKRMAVFPADASIVYGAAGLAALFAQLFRSTSDARCQNASDYWQGQIPEYSVHGEQLSGFRSMTTTEYDLWNMSFGWGIIGIGISLMRQLDPTLPELTPLLMIA